MISNKVKTKFLAKNIIHLKEVDSTQNYIKQLSNVEEGTVVIADRQTNGIGTHDRKWYAGEKENIIMSFILKPKCNISKLSNLTYTIAECMIKAIKNIYDINLSIKIPNDIIYDNKKIGGILTEAKVEGEIAKEIYIGIGINLNEESFPYELENTATSLKKEFGNEYSREKILLEFFYIFEKEYLNEVK